MFHIKELPPVERRANGSLYRMDAKQRREAVRLIRERCSYYDSGNCLYLDRGEEVACPQSISYSVCCKFVRHVLLKDEAGRGLEAEVFRQAAGRRCAVCGRTELDDPCLEFRFCSKCNGNYEYCQDHLFTHEHVK